MRVKEFLALTKNSDKRCINLWVNGYCELGCENGVYHIPEILQDLEIISIDLQSYSTSVYVNVDGLYMTHKGKEITVNKYAEMCEKNWLENSIDSEHLKFYRKG